MVYIANFTNVTNYISLFQNLNSTTTMNGYPLFGIVMLILASAVMFLSMKDYSTGRAFAATFGIMLIPAWGMYALDLTLIYTPVIYTLLFVITALILKWEGG